MQEFKPGDVVRVNPIKGPWMIVESCEESRAVCFWFDKDDAGQSQPDMCCVPVLVLGGFYEDSTGEAPGAAIASGGVPRCFAHERDQSPYKERSRRLLQISEKQVQRLAAEHKLQAQRLGHRTLRFRPEAVDRYLDRNRA